MSSARTRRSGPCRGKRRAQQLRAYLGLHISVPRHGRKGALVVVVPVCAFLPLPAISRSVLRCATIRDGNDVLPGSDWLEIWTKILRYLADIKVLITCMWHI